MDTMRRWLSLAACVALFCICFLTHAALADDLPGNEQYRADLLLPYDSTEIRCSVVEVMEVHSVRLSDGSGANIALLHVFGKGREDVSAPVLLLETDGHVYYQQVAFWVINATLFFADFDADGADDVLAVSDWGMCGGYGGYDWSVCKLSPQGIQLLSDAEFYMGESGYGTFRASPKSGYKLEVGHETLPLAVTFTLPSDHEAASFFFDADGLPDPAHAPDPEYPVMYMDPSYLVYPVVQEDGSALLAIAQYCYTGTHNGSGVGVAYTLFCYDTQRGQFVAVKAAFAPINAEGDVSEELPPWAGHVPDWFTER